MSTKSTPGASHYDDIPESEPAPTLPHNAGESPNTGRWTDQELAKHQAAVTRHAHKASKSYERMSKKAFDK